MSTIAHFLGRTDEPIATVPVPEEWIVRQTPVPVAYQTVDEFFAEVEAVLGPQKMELEDGVCEVEVTGVDGKWVMTVENDDGYAEVNLGGSPGPARDRRLRILLGHSVEEVEEARELLVGKRIKVRLTTYGYGDAGRQRSYRDVKRA
jgi:hypothetical protein